MIGQRESRQRSLGEPTPDDAIRILAAISGGTVDHVRRFPNGLAHFVFDAWLTDGRRLVIRLTRSEQRHDFGGTLYWHPRLVELGVLLPEIIYAELDESVHGFPVLILERLPGVDLGDCYLQLSDEEKRGIALQVVDLQRRVASLPMGPGFGYARRRDDPALKSTWIEVLEAGLERSRRWIHSAGVMNAEPVDRVARATTSFRNYFARVQPTCFLHDTTTKNVIIDSGQLRGIVDVDSVCFGDPLWVLSLTNMAMLSRGYDRVYIDAWSGALDLSSEERSVLALYTAMHCVAFLGEIGQRFNKETAPTIDPHYMDQLRIVLDDLLTRV